MKKILVFLLLMFPYFVNAKSVFKEVRSINELNGNQKIVFVVDSNAFEFVDILKEPINKEVSVDGNYLLTDVGINNIFFIDSDDSSLSGDTLKVKPLVVGDTSVTCSKNTTCKKGNLYLKDDMFHYQDKEIKIQEISEGLFSVRSDNSHYLNFDNGRWIVSSNVQSIKIYREVEEDINTDDKDENGNQDNNVENIETEYYVDDVLLIGQTSKDTSNEKNNGFINIYLYYDKEEVKQTKLNFKYENSNAVDIKIKFVDMYNENSYSNYYDYLFGDEYLSSNNLLTRIYVTQDSSYSLITNNAINYNGGVLDNVLGGSNLHIYVSSKYSTEYYKDKELLDIGSKYKYYINPDSYSIPSGYDDAVDSKILDSITYVDPEDTQEFVYNIDLKDYESIITLPKNEYNYPWYINGKKVNSEFDVATNINEEIDKIFKFTFYTRVENPNTPDGILKFSFILLICMWLFLYIKRYKLS